MRPEMAQHRGLLDVRVRRAIAHGVDKPAASDAIQAGKGLLADAFLSPRLSFYPEIDRVIAKYPHDVRRVQQLMDEAGFVRGGDNFYAGRDGSVFELEVASSSGAKNEQENTIIVDNLRSAGINARTNILPAAQSRDAENYTQRPGVLVWGGGGDIASLDSFTSEQAAGPANRWRGSNYGAWINPEYDQLHFQFGQSLRQSEQVRLMADMNRILTQELPWIPYWYQPLVTAHVAALKGPVPRETPDAPNGIVRIWEWAWQ
jgi:peptide/nickel transport system substrate-binding protein